MDAVENVVVLSVRKVQVVGAPGHRHGRSECVSCFLLKPVIRAGAFGFCVRE